MVVTKLLANPVPFFPKPLQQSGACLSGWRLEVRAAADHHLIQLHHIRLQPLYP